MPRKLTRRAAIEIAAAATLLPTLVGAEPMAAQIELTPTPVGFSEQGLSALDAYFESLVASKQVYGAVSLVSRHGKVAALKSFGMRDQEAQVAMTNDTIFRIYSQSKPVTGVAMMLLHEEGHWRMDDPLTKHIPEFSQLKVLASTQPGGAVVLENLKRLPNMADLMSHTAGFGYGLNPDDPLTPLYQAQNVLGSDSLGQMIEKLATLPLAYQPGTEWRYSISVDIQGYLVEKFTGRSLSEFMSERIFQPLGMKDTGFHVPPSELTRLATLYQYNPEGPPTLFPAAYLGDISKPPKMASGGGGLVSTAADYARFCQMLLSNGSLGGVHILKPESVKMMRTNQLGAKTRLSTVGTPVPLVTAGMGYGIDVAVVIDPVLAGTPVGKGTYFWGGAAGTWFWIDPVEDLFAIGMIHVLRYPDNLKMGNPARTLTYDALT